MEVRYRQEGIKDGDPKSCGDFPLDFDRVKEVEKNGLSRKEEKISVWRTHSGIVLQLALFLVALLLSACTSGMQFRGRSNIAGVNQRNNDLVLPVDRQAWE